MASLQLFFYRCGILFCPICRQCRVHRRTNAGPVVLLLYFRQRRKTFKVIHWYSVVLLTIYVVGAFALFNSRMG